MASVTVDYIKVVQLPDPPYVANAFYLLLDGNNCDQYLATADGTSLKPVLNGPLIQAMINTSIAGLGSGSVATITFDLVPTLGNTGNVVSSDVIARNFNSTNGNVSSLTTTVSGLTTTTGNLNTSVNNLNTNVNNLSTSVNNTNTALTGKVDKVTGKGLSTNDFDNTQQTNLAAAKAHADITNGNPHGTTPVQMGLGNVVNLDFRDPNNISWTNSRGTLSSTERAAWNSYATSKQDKLVDGGNLSTVNGFSLQSGTPITIGSGVSINDTTPSGSSVYSSNKTESRLSAKLDTTGNLPATQVTPDSSHLFTTAAQQATWNNNSGSGADFWSSAKAVGGAVGDGVANDSAALQAQFVSNSIVYLPVGVYLLGSTITLSSINNLKIVGSKNSKLTGTIKTLISLTNCNNIEIIDVIFETTASDSVGTDTTNGLIKINGGANVRVRDCTFNATNALTDAIKVLVDDTHQVTNLRIDKNYFNGIGQRGIGMTSTAFIHINLSDVFIQGNWFNNLGLKSVANGQAVYIKVYSARIKVIDNDVKDATGVGMEFDGIQSLSLISNDMYAPNRAYQPYKITSTTTGQTTFDLKLVNATVSVVGAEDHTIQIENISKFTIAGCHFNTGTVKIKGTNGRISSNTILSDGQRAVWIEATSDKLSLIGNHWDNSFATTPLEPFFTEGAGVTNIRAVENSWYSAVGNIGSSITSGSSNITYSNIWGS